jgi:hypothetical protein
MISLERIVTVAGSARLDVGKSRDSSVGIPTDYGLDDRGSNPGGG